MSIEPNRRTFLKAVGAVAGATAVGGLAFGETPAMAATSPWDQVPTILARIKPPTFPNRTFDITDYGAIGDNKFLCTDAFNKAIAACNKAGGGHVVVPTGTFRTGAIHLLSNVDLHVTSGGTIRFSKATADFLPVVYTRYEGTECYNYSPFVYAYGKTNVAITGPGKLDGYGSKGEFAGWSSGGPDSDKLRQQGQDGVPVSQRVYGAGHKLRPNMIQFYKCTNVLIQDVTVLDSPMWTIHPVLSTNVTVQNVTVHSIQGQGDGCDPEACTDVHIIGCRFDTNDDCIAIKSGRNNDGRRVGVATQNVVIENCAFAGRWGGVTIGSEMSGGVKNVFAQNCTVNPASFPGKYPVKYALYIKTNKLRGGTIDGVHLRNITGGKLDRDAIYVLMSYNGGEGGTLKPVVQNIDVDGMVIDGGQAAVNLVGLSDDHMNHVHISNSTFTNMANKNSIAYADDVTFTNVKINGKTV
jgi:polygalacturonase